MVAGKDRLYRALDKALEHRDALMGHLQERWSELFGAEGQILLYDLTSTYFEGEAAGVPAAARGYSRDHRALWRQYVQLTEVEAAFRALKSELAIRPIWHRIQRRLEAHILVAFLGYCLWVCLKQMLKTVAQSITPARALESLRSILMVEVWFNLRDGGQLCLPRITEPGKGTSPPAPSLSLAPACSTPSTHLPPSGPQDHVSANQALSRKSLD